jgi:hypothetical protein
MVSKAIVPAAGEPKSGEDKDLGENEGQESG